jgi:hypothetical protein
MWRIFRIVILLLILAVVGLSTVLTRLRTSSWEQPVRVAVFPINGDDRDATASYIAGLTQGKFEPVAEFMHSEAGRYGIGISEPITVTMGPELRAHPPATPAHRSGLEVILWSMQLRYWAWRHGDLPGPSPHVRVFVIYFDPETQPRVAHSLGLQKGMIGVVHAFASRMQTAQNNVVIAHELLHTLGATDKYDLENNLPRHPDGYAEPDKVPLYPQQWAEIMGGRVPLSDSKADMPSDLTAVLVGSATAQEIGWTKK